MLHRLFAMIAVSMTLQAAPVGVVLTNHGHTHWSPVNQAQLQGTKNHHHHRG
ncbi:hypothetical protein [Ligilactobacillus hohenheimensis]|uniref:hypothetical protein n=1 Tax=Ligilactobacillus hohenheimensis TaxID=2991832 RepID=UPI0024B9FDD0|nr:hypothetical protein [Ligilactobacillus hohenheimensis]